MWRRVDVKSSEKGLLNVVGLPETVLSGDKRSVEEMICTSPWF